MGTTLRAFYILLFTFQQPYEVTTSTISIQQEETGLEWLSNLPRVHT